MTDNIFFFVKRESNCLSKLFSFFFHIFLLSESEHLCFVLLGVLLQTAFKFLHFLLSKNPIIVKFVDLLDQLFNALLQFSNIPFVLLNSAF